MTAQAALSSRPYAGHDDLRAMEALVSEAWLGAARPLVPCTIGDLEWWFAGGGPDADWPERIRIWSIGGDPVGWGWISPPAGLEWFVKPGLAAAEETPIRDEILGWHADHARMAAAAGATAVPESGSAPVVLEAWAGEGWSEAALLEARGWTASDVVLTQYLQPLDLELDAPRVPEGYILRSLRGPEDVAARVEVHRAAFAPSRLTVEKYAVLRSMDRYALERDIVLEAPDGSFAAFAMCWSDPLGSIGEFEPVGVHPDHQRRGLGRVIMRHGLRLMRKAGLRDALVFSLRSNVASEALYRSAGFRPVAFHRRYTRPLAR